MSRESKSTLEEIVSKLLIKEIAAVFSAALAPFAIVWTLHRFIQFSDNTFELLLTFTVSGTLAALLLIVIFREVMSSRKEKYANITEKHHFCFHTARDIESYLEELEPSRLDEDEKKRVLTVTAIGLVHILDDVATIYSMLTGTRCRAAVKTIYEKDGRIYVRTLARDRDSYEHNFIQDKARWLQNKDAIEENEDFELLFRANQPGQTCFFSNNLIERRNYKTSSFKEYGEPNKEMSWYERMLCKGWTLPYRSAIVWPIQQKASSYFQLKEAGCIGFLAVDSESRGVFKKKWDTWLGAGIADALFHPINKAFKVIDEPDVRRAMQ